MDNWQGKKVLILGAARQGMATLSYLLKKGALPTVNDIQPAEEFQDLMRQFEGQNIEWVFGEHPISLLDNTDLIVVSAGVPLSLPILHEAAHRGIPLTNDSQIFMEAVQSKVIGITGSAGKTTTTILVGEIAKKSAQDNQKVWVGGNIGSPLIASLDEIQPSDLVVLELSSFQLELMTISPSIAAILNITPNHLDRHETMAVYIDAKSQILRYQSSRDTAILNCEDATTMELKPLVRGQLITFGHQSSKNRSVYVEADHLVYRQNSKTTILMPCNRVKLKGEHNLLNALAAGAVAIAAGFSPQAIQAGIESVSSIPHRLEWVREWRGINWYNDSIATAPERTAAAIQSFLPDFPERRYKKVP